eukprot:scaffold244841_cov34-Tisochrysis_lutea.AAC.1
MAKKAPPPPLGPLSAPAADETHVVVRKVVVIYNPKAGKGKAKHVLERVVLPALQAAAVGAVVVQTARQAHTVELARTVDLGGVDALCAIGGDGTISELVTGFLQRPDAEQAAVGLGFIPAGTGNALMREWAATRPPKHLPAAADAKKIVDAIISGRCRQMDVVRGECQAADGSPFTRMSVNAIHWGLGTDANVQAEKLRMLGPIRYDLGILYELMKMRKRPCTITAKGAVNKTPDVSGDGVTVDPDGTISFSYNGVLVSAMNSSAQALGDPQRW